MDFAIGQRVADYEIEQLIGVGGMGRVYRVRNVISHRTEAMKVLLADLNADPELAARFLSEIRTLAALYHPHIAQLHTAMQNGNDLIMMMEFVDGSTLQQLAQEGPLPPDKIYSYMHQVLDALSFAHSQGVIHRDIKPANIMVTPSGMVKLTDFGIAKSKIENELTRPGTTVGSLNYMSPEQALGGCIDGRADFYSLGIAMYELLAGCRPFDDESAYVVLQRQLNTTPRPPTELNPLLSQPLSDMIMKALEKDPAQRFQTAVEFSDALREATGIAASTPVRSYPAFAFKARNVPEALAIAVPKPRTATRNRLKNAAIVSAGAGVLGLAAFSLPHFLIAGGPRKTVEHSITQPSSISSATAERSPLSATGPKPATITPEPAMSQSTAVEPVPDVIAAPGGKQAFPTVPGQAPATVTVAPLAESATTRGPAVERKLARANYKVATLRRDNSQAPDEGHTVSPATMATRAELQPLRDQASILDARATNLRVSVQRLKSEKEAAGDGLNQDVANAYVRMNAYLSAGKIEVEEGDAASARDHLDKAKSEEDILDKLFSR